MTYGFQINVVNTSFLRPANHGKSEEEKFEKNWILTDGGKDDVPLCASVVYFQFFPLPPPAILILSSKDS